MPAQGPRWLDIFNENVASDQKSSSEPLYTPSLIESFHLLLYILGDTHEYLYISQAYTLSTVLSTASGVFPRSRSVIHRGIIRPTASRPLLLTTTDIRTPKSHQLHINSNTEATFWFPKPNSQFRIIASAYCLPHPDHPWVSSFPRIDLAGSESQQFDWEGERLKAFDSLSGHLRASFVRPVPGTPLESYDEGEKWPEVVPKRGEAEDQRAVQEALSNFALVVLDPMEIDFVELSPIPNRRTTWKKKGDIWEEQIVVP